MVYINLNNYDFIKEHCMGFEHIPFLDVNKFKDDGGKLQEFVKHSYHCFILYGHVFNYEHDVKASSNLRKKAFNLTDFSKENSFEDWFDGYFKTAYIINDDLYVLLPAAGMTEEICITQNDDLFKLVKDNPELLGDR